MAEKPTHYITRSGKTRVTQEYADAYLEWWLQPITTRLPRPKVVIQSNFDMEYCARGLIPKQTARDLKKERMDNAIRKLYLIHHGDDSKIPPPKTLATPQPTIEKKVTFAEIYKTLGKPPKKLTNVENKKVNFKLIYETIGKPK